MEAMTAAFPETNSLLLRESALDCEVSGSTAVLALISEDNNMTVANLGDSRCILGTPGQAWACSATCHLRSSSSSSSHLHGHQQPATCMHHLTRVHTGAASPSPHLHPLTRATPHPTSH